MSCTALGEKYHFSGRSGVGNMQLTRVKTRRPIQKNHLKQKTYTGTRNNSGPDF